MAANQQGHGEGQEIRARNLEQLLQRTIALQQDPNSHAQEQSNLTDEVRHSSLFSQNEFVDYPKKIITPE